MRSRINIPQVIPYFLLAAALAGLATAIDTNTWAEWFQHPARRPMPEVTRQGAILWRIMLAVSAAALASFPLALQQSRARHIAPTPAPLSRGERFSRRTRLWMLSGVVVLAFAVRATRITESLWYDEIASWLAYGAGIDHPGPIIANYFDPVNHVFHTLLSWWSVRWCESTLGTEIALRLPALSFSLISVAVMYGMTRAAMNERTAIMAALLTAVLPVSVLEGVEARGYSMMICFSALMTWSFLEAMRRQALWLWSAYAAVCALGIWSHFVSAFVPIGHTVWLAWRIARHQEWRQAVAGCIALVLAAILTITLYSPLLPEMLQTRTMFLSSRGDEPTILGAEGWHALLQLGGSWYGWAAWPGLLFALLGVISLIRNKQGREAKQAVVLSLLGLPLMLLTVAMSGSWMYARFTLFALPGALLLMAAGIETVWSRRRAAGLAAVGIIGISAAGDLMFRPPKQPLRNAAEHVRVNRNDNDRLLAIGLAHEVMRVYAIDLNLMYSLRHGRDLAEQLASHQPSWVIVEYPKSVPQEVYDQLNTNGFVPDARFSGWVDWTNGDVIVYRIRSSPRREE